MTILAFILLFGCIATSAARLPCNDVRVLRSEGVDNNWFKIELNPDEGMAKFQKLLHGNGWNDGEHSFKVERDADQTISIEAADGSLFAVKKAQLKTTNTDCINFTGVLADDSEVNYKKDPRPMTKFRLWEKTVLRDRKNYVKRFIIKADLHDHNDDDPKRLHKIYMRGLKVTVCLPEAP